MDLGIARQPCELYGRTYYPGTPDAAEATEILIAPGVPVPEIHFQLPKPRPPVTIRGTVIYSDGTPASVADVYFSSVGGYAIAQLWTNSDGSFLENNYGGVAFRISSRSHDEKLESRVIVIDAANLEKPLVLVLSEHVTDPSKPPQ